MALSPVTIKGREATASTYSIRARNRCLSEIASMGEGRGELGPALQRIVTLAGPIGAREDDYLAGLGFGYLDRIAASAKHGRFNVSAWACVSRRLTFRAPLPLGRYYA